MELKGLPEIITIGQLSEYLKISRQTVVRALVAGKLQGFKVGREWRIEKEAVFKWLKK